MDHIKTDDVLCERSQVFRVIKSSNFVIVYKLFVWVARIPLKLYAFTGWSFTTRQTVLFLNMSQEMVNPIYVKLEQQRRRSACASAQAG